LKMPGSRDFVTSRTQRQHEENMTPALSCDVSRSGPEQLRAPPTTASLDAQVVELYDRYFDFVWRSLCRLGVPPADLEDAAQDVFIVVHRRLATYEERGSVKSWIFGIALRVAKIHRQRGAQRRAQISADESVLVCTRGSPEELRAKMQAAEQVQLLLDELDDDKRAVFVLAELEHMPASEISQALGIPANTVYSRLRLARAAFDNGLKRLRAKDDWRRR
jgi:RNA polymerase sigma-70 factor, ECF subfamily